MRLVRPSSERLASEDAEAPTDCPNALSVAASLSTYRSAIHDLGALRAFVAVVETSSFSEAGRQLSVVPSTVSKLVAALESRIKARLLVRSTAHLAITEIGQLFYDRCLVILREVEETEALVGEYNSDPQGILRISAPTVFGTKHLRSPLIKFMEKYPRVDIDLSLTTENKDLVAGGIDVALRLSKELDPALTAIKLAPNVRVYCASPEYLKRFGTPKSIEDLINHNCIVLRGVPQSAQWPIVAEARERQKQVAVGGRFVCDNGDLVSQMILEGMGIGHLGRFIVYDYLQSGRLVELFPEHRIVASYLYAVYSQRRHMPLKSRVFLDHIREEFRVAPAWA